MTYTYCFIFGTNASLKRPDRKEKSNAGLEDPGAGIACTMLLDVGPIKQLMNKRNFYFESSA